MTESLPKLLWKHSIAFWTNWKVWANVGLYMIAILIAISVSSLLELGTPFTVMAGFLGGIVVEQFAYDETVDHAE